MSCRIAAFTFVVCIILLELLCFSLAKPAHELRAENKERIKRETSDGNYHPAIEIPKIGQKRVLSVKSYDTDGGKLQVLDADRKELIQSIDLSVDAVHNNRDIFPIRSQNENNVLKITFKEFNLVNQKEYINLYDQEFKLLTSNENGNVYRYPLVEKGDVYYSDGSKLNLEFYHGYFNDGDKGESFEIEVEQIEYEPIKNRASKRDNDDTSKLQKNSHFNLCDLQSKNLASGKLTATPLDFTSFGHDTSKLTGEIWSTSEYQEDPDTEIPSDIYSCSVEFKVNTGDAMKFDIKQMHISQDQGGSCRANKLVFSGDTVYEYCHGQEKNIKITPTDNKITVTFHHRGDEFVAANGFWFSYQVLKKEETDGNQESNEPSEPTPQAEITEKVRTLQQAKINDPTPMIFFIGAAVVAILLIVILAVAGIVACMRTHQQDQLINTLTEQLTNQQYTPVDGSLVSLSKSPPSIILRRPTETNIKVDIENAGLLTSQTSSPTSSKESQ